MGADEGEECSEADLVEGGFDNERTSPDMFLYTPTLYPVLHTLIPDPGP